MEVESIIIRRITKEPQNRDKLGYDLAQCFQDLYVHVDSSGFIHIGPKEVKPKTEAEVQQDRKRREEQQKNSGGTTNVVNINIGEVNFYRK